MKKQLSGSRFTIHHSLFTFFIVLFLAVPFNAFGAEKLIVNNSSGGTGFVVTDDPMVGIGTASPAAQLHIAADGLTNATVRLDGASDNATTKGMIIFIRARGSHSAPTAVQADDFLGVLGVNAYDGSAYEGDRGFFLVTASENWTPTAGGYRFIFKTRSNGTVGAPTERMRIENNGNVGIGTTTPTQLLDVNSNGMRIEQSMTPATSSDACNQGQIAWDANYVYVCVAANMWKRSALASW